MVSLFCILQWEPTNRRTTNIKYLTKYYKNRTKLQQRLSQSYQTLCNTSPLVCSAVMTPGWNFPGLHHDDDPQVNSNVNVSRLERCQTPASVLMLFTEGSSSVGAIWCWNLKKDREAVNRMSPEPHPGGFRSTRSHRNYDRLVMSSSAPAQQFGQFTVLILAIKL